MCPSSHFKSAHWKGAPDWELPELKPTLYDWPSDFAYDNIELNQLDLLFWA